MRTINHFALSALMGLGACFSFVTGCEVAPSPNVDVSSSKNSLDVDGDGVDDNLDNCVGVMNPEQVNTDGDDMGDACDPDIDNDGALNGADNCQLVQNLDQANLDGDAEGDLCDADMDGDDVANVSDNCQTVWNPMQLDLDMDGDGDACSSDCDGDGLDNFPVGDNTSIQDCRQQFQDNDGDGLTPEGGDCRDDNANIHPGAPELCNGIDEDCDGTPDDGLMGCVPPPLPDGDGDGIANVNDNCPAVINQNQHDADVDGMGDACDPAPMCNPAGVEICDGIDNNCNGDIDEGVMNACGQCGDVPVEICDNVDNDCDGTIDEDLNLGAACSAGVGECMEAGVLVCNNEGGTMCNATPGDPIDEVCMDNGLDEDCDGVADDGCDDDMDGIPEICAVGAMGCVADNCPNNSNRVQGDRDLDTVGDACDADCQWYFQSAPGAFLEYMLEDSPILNAQGIAMGQWFDMSSLVEELCIMNNEDVLLTSTTDGQPDNYALTGNCGGAGPVRNMGYFVEGDDPFTSLGAGGCRYFCTDGPNYLCESAVPN